MRTLILTSKYTAPVTDAAELAASVGGCQIYAEELNEKALTGCDLLINALGNKYCSDSFAAVVSYIKKGGSLINLTPDPFTEPFHVKDGKIVYSPKCVEAALELRYATPVQYDGKVNNPVLKPALPIYEKLSDFLSDVGITGLWSPAYHISSRPEGIDKGYHDIAHVDGAVYYPVSCTDNGTVKAAPVAKISFYEKGCVYCVNFESDKISGKYAELAKLLYEDFILPHCDISLKTQYSLYRPDEKIKAVASVIMRRPANCRFILSCTNCEQSFDASGSFEKEFDLGNLPEGEHLVSLKVIYNDNKIAEKTFGFIVVSEQTEKEKMSEYVPLILDTSVAPDYMTKNGKPFPMHGANFFCTDGMRAFLLKVNTDQLRKDLVRLRELGFNILRTGIWHDARSFYNKDGTLTDMAKRNIKALFYIAAEEDFTIQFVLDSFSFNVWDRSRTPFFADDMKQCTINAVKSFCEELKYYKNVQLDIVNEPSYSLNAPWSLAIPSGEKEELAEYRQFLKERYSDDINMLRDAWGATPTYAPSFDEIELPKGDWFYRNEKYDRKADFIPRMAIRDFYDFADTAFAMWVKELKDTADKIHGGIYVTLGRDQPPRVPTHHRGTAFGGYDFTSWHQWHKDSIILTEYMLCKMRNKVCCAQEIGAYPYSDYRYGEKLTEKDLKNALQRKLLYSFGNYIMWQAQSDHEMTSPCEYQLGVIRADGSETPSCSFLRDLNRFEDIAAPYMIRRKEDDEIVLVYPESLHFSVDSSFAQTIFADGVITLHQSLSRQPATITESMLNEKYRDYIGSPKLYILADGLMLREDAWQFLLKEVSEGATLLLTGDPDTDEYGRDRKRLSTLTDMPYTRRCCRTYEKFVINGKEHTSYIGTIPNYYSPGKLFTCLEFNNGGITALRHGKGKIIYCSSPVCGGDAPARKALYEYAVKEAGLDTPAFESDGDESVLIYPMKYEKGTLYTIINDGPAKEVHFKDNLSGKTFSISLQAEGGAKLFIAEDGKLISSFIG